jgi:hypothetical protein
MEKKYILAGCIIVGLLVALSGCVEEKPKEGDGEEVPTDTSFVEFKVTDKVTEVFDHVNITFSEIRLFNQTEDNESYITVVSDPTTVDLVYLNLSNINASLGVAEIKVGNYSKLWINVSKAVGVLNSTGEEVNISVPSGWLKIQQLHMFNVTKGNHTITVDIDLENSIHEFHGGEEYKFIPVISSIEHHHEKKLKFREHQHSKLKNMVGNRKPAIDLLVNGSVVTKKVTLESDIEYEFNASGTLDLDGDELTYSWDFGDGTEDTGAIVNHNYTNESITYQLWLTVSDGTEYAKYHIVVKIDTSKGKGNGPN